MRHRHRRARWRPSDRTAQLLGTLGMAVVIAAIAVLAILLTPRPAGNREHPHTTRVIVPSETSQSSAGLGDWTYLPIGPMGGE